MDQEKNREKIVQFTDRAFLRDKQKAQDELNGYFVKKNRQIQAAQILSALKSSLRKKHFTVEEAKKITAYLARKFDIRRPAIQYAEAGFLSTTSSLSTSTRRTKIVGLEKKHSLGEEFFQQLFTRLQSAVQDNLLDYNGARVLVREFVDHYPSTRDRLQ